MTANPIKLGILDLVPVSDEIDAAFALGQAVELAQAAEYRERSLPLVSFARKQRKRQRGLHPRVQLCFNKKHQI